MINVIKVGKNHQYKKINDAISAINQPTLIELDDELYNEKVVINKPNIIIDGKNKAQIIYNDYAIKIHDDGREYVTFRTYTVLVKAPHVTLMNLKIVNNAGEGYKVGQAVALHLYNDDITCINCHLEARQDTLFCGPFPPDLIKRYIDLLPEDERLHNGEFHQKFIRCKIEGTVDFIFGGGSTEFIDCDIISLPSSKTTWIVAPCHNQENKSGFTFINCNFISKTFIDTVYLARPWREYGLVNFINCHLDDHIKKAGFSIWEGTERHKNCRFNEINSSGIGACNDARISWANVK